MADFNQQVIDEFRANKGVVGGMFEGMPLLLMHTTGAKSGTTRVIPVVYTTDGDDLVVIASKGGADTNPDWYHNLVAHPNVKVEVGTDSYDVVVTEAKGDEHDRLYDQQADQFPQFNDYKKKTTRIIPVFILKKKV
jgi:deazaflavin-dependent oxidoreductase (nitroreductase family)